MLLCGTLGREASAQAEWRRVGTSSDITQMQSHGLAYDASRDRVVRYGGYSCNGRNSTTWEWDGEAWEQVLPPQSPPSRTSTAMVYDSHRKVCVMFGGALDRDDTWEWDGIDWTDKSAIIRPSGRYGHAMVYDLPPFRWTRG